MHLKFRNIAHLQPLTRFYPCPNYYNVKFRYFRMYKFLILLSLVVTANAVRFSPLILRFFANLHFFPQILHFFSQFSEITRNLTMDVYTSMCEKMGYKYVMKDGNVICNNDDNGAKYIFYMNLMDGLFGVCSFDFA
jgi:hypothetical protein